METLALREGGPRCAWADEVIPARLVAPARALLRPTDEVADEPRAPRLDDAAPRSAASPPPPPPVRRTLPDKAVPAGLTPAPTSTFPASRQHLKTKKTPNNPTRMTMQNAIMTGTDTLPEPPDEGGGGGAGVAEGEARSESFESRYCALLTCTALRMAATLYSTLIHDWCEIRE